jgi:hypothetical protein
MKVSTELLVTGIVITGAVALMSGLASAKSGSAVPGADGPPEGSEPGEGFIGPGLTQQTTAAGRVYQVWTWAKPNLSYRVARLAGSTLWIAFQETTGGPRVPAKSNTSGTLLNTLKSDWALPV